MFNVQQFLSINMTGFTFCTPNCNAEFYEKRDAEIQEERSFEIQRRLLDEMCESIGLE